MNYPGGKNGGGAYQNIINLIPPHRVYIEPFAGSAAIWRNKLPAEQSILIDRSTAAVQSLLSMVDRDSNTVVLKANALKELRELFGDHQFNESVFGSREDVFIYADPPYLPETRTKKKIYDHEMSFDDHCELLNTLIRIPSMVAISGYPSSLYAQFLQGWSRYEYDAMTRGGMRRECVWFNYDYPTRLHDYRYLGSDKTDRQRIRRKVSRWQSKLSSLPDLERNAIIDGIQQLNLSASADAAENGYGRSRI